VEIKNLQAKTKFLLLCGQLGTVSVEPWW